MVNPRSCRKLLPITSSSWKYFFLTTTNYSLLPHGIVRIFSSKRSYLRGLRAPAKVKVSKLFLGVYCTSKVYSILASARFSCGRLPILPVLAHSNLKSSRLWAHHAWGSILMSLLFLLSKIGALEAELSSDLAGSKIGWRMTNLCRLKIFGSQEKLARERARTDDDYKDFQEDLLELMIIS